MSDVVIHPPAITQRIHELHQARSELVKAVGAHYKAREYQCLRSWRRGVLARTCTHGTSPVRSKSTDHCLQCMREVQNSMPFGEKWGVLWIKDELNPCCLPICDAKSCWYGSNTDRLQEYKESYVRFGDIGKRVLCDVCIDNDKSIDDEWSDDFGDAFDSLDTHL